PVQADVLAVDDDALLELGLPQVVGRRRLWDVAEITRGVGSAPPVGPDRADADRGGAGWPAYAPDLPVRPPPVLFEQAEAEPRVGAAEQAVRPDDPGDAVVVHQLVCAEPAVDGQVGDRPPAGG